MRALLLGLVCLWPVTASATPARIVVDAARAVGRAPEHISGHFFEVMNDSVIGGIWAEMLPDRSFEGADRDGNGLPDTWHSLGGGGFATDAETAVPWRQGGWDHSLRVTATSPGGIACENLLLRRNEQYRVSLWLKQEGMAVEVTVALTAADGKVYASRTAAAGKDWGSFSCLLAPRVDDRQARFAITWQGAGTLWLDKASLMPQDTVHGFRRDVVAAVKALRPTVIRFPGGNFAQGHHWTDAIGPRDLRPNIPNFAWGWAPNNNELGVDEFMALCREVGAEPMLCVNIGDSGSQVTAPDNGTERAFTEALALLDYCNGDPARSEWAARRADNGHPEPYRVRYWEIGNEIWGDWEIGHLDAWSYARRFREFARALRARDPTIEVFASGDDLVWNRTLFEVAPDQVDWLVLHHYFASGSFADCAAEPANYARFIDETRALHERLRPGKQLRISFNEWNTSFGPELSHSMTSGVWGACFQHEMIRRGDVVRMLNVSDLVNGWCGGIIQVQPGGLYTTPLYDTIRLLARHGPELVRAEAACATFDTPRQGVGHPVLDVVASRSADGRQLCVSVVNKTTRPIEAELLLAGCRATRGERWTVGADPAIYNSPSRPQAVPLQHATADPGARLNLPPASLTLLAFPITLQAAGKTAATGSGAPPAGTVWAESESGRWVEGAADAQGRFRLELEPGIWRIGATAPDRPVCLLPEPVAATGAELSLPPLDCSSAQASDAIACDFAGSRLPDLFTLAYLEGESGGTWRLEGGTLTLRGGPNTRFGLLSAPIPDSDRRGFVVEAKVHSYAGTNALMTVTGGSGPGDFSHFVEVGVERGRAQVWAGEASATGRETRCPAALAMLVGPPRPDGSRLVECRVNGRLVQRIPGYRELGGGPWRVFLYGWGDSETVWDSIRLTPVMPPAVSGRVTGSGGQPLAGVPVTAQGMGATTTGADGTYRLPGLLAGAVRVVAGGGEWGIVQREIELSGPEATVDFTLAPVPASGMLWDDFTTFDRARWDLQRHGNRNCSMEVREGSLHLQSAAGSSAAVISQPVSGTAAGTVRVSTRVLHFVGEAISLHVGGIYWSLRDGGLVAGDGRQAWWPPEGRIAVPCDLAVVIGPPGPGGERAAEFRYNGMSMHRFPAAAGLSAGQDFTVGLGGGNCQADFGWIAVERGG